MTHSTIRLKRTLLYADLGAEKTIAAERAGEKIVVEIKSFLHPSPIQDLKAALGQYILYLSLLAKTDPDRILYLAIAETAYNKVFQDDVAQVVMERFPTRLIVIDEE